MITAYFTFGVQYARTPHPILGQVAHPDGWAEVTAPTYDEAVRAFWNLTQGAYAFDYPEEPSLNLFPRGCLLRIDLTPPKETP